MRKFLAATLIAGSALAMVLAGTSVAYAFPTRTSQCSGCHTYPDPTVVVTATEASNDGVNATYDVTVSNPYGVSGWAVFSGSTNIANATASSGSFTVAVGKTYTVWGVSNGGSGTGSNNIVVSPVAPAPVPVPTPVPTVTPDPTPVPVPDPTPVPTVTPDPTPVPVPDPTPVPTVTPDPTPVPVPDPTPVPTVTPDPTPVPTITPDPQPVPGDGTGSEGDGHDSGHHVRRHHHGDGEVSRRFDAEALRAYLSEIRIED